MFWLEDFFVYNIYKYTYMYVKENVCVVSYNDLNLMSTQVKGVTSNVFTYLFI